MEWGTATGKGRKPVACTGTSQMFVGKKGQVKRKGPVRSGDSPGLLLEFP